MPILSAEKDALALRPGFTCVSEVFPEPSQVRRLLAIGGLWVSTKAGHRVLVLHRGASLLLQTRRWHDLYSGAIRAAVKARSDESGARSVIGLLQEPVQVGALSIVQLLTQSEFLLESVEMEHCVASRFGFALSASAAFFSVRTDAGLRLSTFGLSVQRTNGALEVFVDEQRRPRKSRPGREAMAAAALAENGPEYCTQMRVRKASSRKPLTLIGLGANRV